MLFVVVMTVTCNPIFVSSMTYFSITLLNLVRNYGCSVPTQMFFQLSSSYCQWDRITIYNMKVNPSDMNNLLANTDEQTLSTSDNNAKLHATKYEMQYL